MDESKLVLSVETRQASKNLDKLDKGLLSTEHSGDKTARSLKRLAMGFLSLSAVKKVNAWYAENTRLAGEKEIAATRLASIARTVTKATEGEIRSLKALANQYQETTTLGNSVVEMGLSQLLSFGVTAKEAGLLSSSLNDLTVANAGVDASGRDAINSANMMGKALTGQAGALSRAGVLLDARQKKLIQEGNQAQRVAALIEIMDANYGGLAESMGKTARGINQIKTNKIADLRAEIGSELLPAINNVKDATIEWYSFILKNSAGVSQGISKVASGIKGAAQNLSLLNTAAKIAELEAIPGKLETVQKRLAQTVARRVPGMSMADIKQNAMSMELYQAAVEKLTARQSELRKEIYPTTQEIGEQAAAAKAAAAELAASDAKAAAAAERRRKQLAALEKLEAQRAGAKAAGIKLDKQSVAELYKVTAAETKRIDQVNVKYRALWFSLDETAAKNAEMIEVINTLDQAEKDLNITQAQKAHIMGLYKKSIDGSAESLIELQSKIKGTAEDMRGVGSAAVEDFGSTITEQLVKGEADWEQFAVSVIGHIGDIIAKLIIMKSLQSGLGAIGGGGSAGASAGASVGSAIASGVAGSASSAAGASSAGAAAAAIPTPSVSIVIQGNADAQTVNDMAAQSQAIARQVKQEMINDIRTGGALSRAVGRKV